MRKPIRGFTCTWAVLFAGYIIAGLCDPYGFLTIPDKPDAISLAIGVFVIAIVFSVGVLFIIVWPQILLVGWIVRRFHAPRFYPFALFFCISSIVVGILDFWAGDKNLLIAYLIGTGYLLVSCSILWLISFRHEPVV